jgi:hypothetical protein
MKDHVKTDGIEIQHCPTDKMLADFFTKPLQGSLFRKFRDVLLGYKHINSLKTSNMPTSSPEERVEISEDMNKDVQDRDIGSSKQKEECGTKSTQSMLKKEKVGTESTWSLVRGRKNNNMASTGHRYTKILSDSFAKHTTLQTIPLSTS